MNLHLLPARTKSFSRSRVGVFRAIPITLFVFAVLLSGGKAMGQDGSTSTSQEIDALKAKIDTLNEQVQLLNAEKAVQDAQSAKNAAAQIDAATQAANLAAQQKNLSDLQTAIQKNNLTVPESGYKGDVTAGTNAGSFEAALLASKALTTAADTIAESKPPMTKLPIGASSFCTEFPRRLTSRLR